MAVFRKPFCSLGSKKAFFMHNWRCAGSTMNSLLSSNFGDYYCKIGTQFSDFGWPLYDAPEKLTLREARLGLTKGVILGGHLCLGIESFIPGNWDLWLNARKPLERLSSGIVRFHSKSFRMPSGEYRIDDVREHSNKIISKLMAGPLKHECNGISKRMAGFAVAESLDIHPFSNLETVSCFEHLGPQEVLFDAALQRINDLKIVIVPEYLHAALLCIEKIYDLSPIINLFSNLKHNSSSIGKATETDKKIFEFCKPVLEQYCSQDEKLWVHISRKFQSQLDSCCIDKKEVLVRKALHSKVLFSDSIFSSAKSESQLIEIIVERLVNVAKTNPELSENIIDTATSWLRFDPSAAVEIRDRAKFVLRVN